MEVLFDIEELSERCNYFSAIGDELAYIGNHAQECLHLAHISGGQHASNCLDFGRVGPYPLGRDGVPKE